MKCVHKNQDKACALGGYCLECSENMGWGCNKWMDFGQLDLDLMPFDNILGYIFDIFT